MENSILKYASVVEAKKLAKLNFALKTKLMKINVLGIFTNTASFMES
jgi:hypothetical protein